MSPETRQMLLMKYYSKLFESAYNYIEKTKRKERFMKRQEKRFQASRERY